MGDCFSVVGFGKGAASSVIAAVGDNVACANSGDAFPDVALVGIEELDVCGQICVGWFQ